MAEDVYITHRDVIINNIIPCEDTYDAFVRFKVITPSIVDELRKIKNRISKNQKILDHAVASSISVVRFCDALDYSGHAFLADHVRSEAMADEDILLDMSRVTERFKDLEKLMPSKTLRDEMYAYLQMKLQEFVTRRSWKENRNDKGLIIAIRQQHLKDHLRLNSVIVSQSQNLDTLKTDLERAVDNVQTKGEELKELSNYLYEMKNEHTQDVGMQLKFNVANEKSMIRLSGRQKDQEEIVTKMYQRMHPYLLEVAQRSGKDTYQTDGKEDYQLTVFDKASNACDFLFQRIELLEGIRNNYLELLEDVTYLLSNLQIKPDQSGLRNSFKEYIIRQEKGTMALKLEIERDKHDLEIFMEIVAQLEHDLQRSQDTVQSLRKETRKKDSRIGVLESLLSSAGQHIQQHLSNEMSGSASRLQPAGTKLSTTVLQRRSSVQIQGTKSGGTGVEHKKPPGSKHKNERSGIPKPSEGVVHRVPPESTHLRSNDLDVKHYGVGAGKADETSDVQDSSQSVTETTKRSISRGDKAEDGTHKETFKPVGKPLSAFVTDENQQQASYNDTKARVEHKMHSTGTGFSHRIGQNENEQKREGSYTPPQFEVGIQPSRFATLPPSGGMTKLKQKPVTPDDKGRRKSIQDADKKLFILEHIQDGIAIQGHYQIKVKKLREDLENTSFSKTAVVAAQKIIQEFAVWERIQTIKDITGKAQNAGTSFPQAALTSEEYDAVLATGRVTRTVLIRPDESNDIRRVSDMVDKKLLTNTKTAISGVGKGPAAGVEQFDKEDENAEWAKYGPWTMPRKKRVIIAMDIRNPSGDAVKDRMVLPDLDELTSLIRKLTEKEDHDKNLVAILKKITKAIEGEKDTRAGSDLFKRAEIFRTVKLTMAEYFKVKYLKSVLVFKLDSEDPPISLESFGIPKASEKMMGGPLREAYRHDTRDDKLDQKGRAIVQEEFSIKRRLDPRHNDKNNNNPLPQSHRISISSCSAKSARLIGANKNAHSNTSTSANEFKDSLKLPQIDRIQALARYIRVERGKIGF